MDSGPKAEGTFRVEGMLQGPILNDMGDTQSRLDQWMSSVRAKGLQVSIDWSGGQFSLLAEGNVVQRSALTGESDLGELLQEIFEGLLSIFPVERRMEFFSTLRSVEYRPGEEVQTVYAVAPPGTIHSQARVLNAETVRSVPGISGRGKMKLAIIGLVFLLVLGVTVALLYKEQWGEVVDNLGKLEKEDIRMETDAFEGFISVTIEKIDRQAGGLVVEVRKGELWPGDIANHGARVPEGMEWRTLLAVQSLRRGYVRCEIFDKAGKFIYSADLRTGGLLEPEREAIKAVIPLPRGERPAQVKLMF
ncbi:MAG: hypothetical protein MK183_00270 [Verrucomicrobiales bacterium]|nr:hypothetical protein [Verrucomicrobiales bacterium]